MSIDETCSTCFKIFDVNAAGLKCGGKCGRAFHRQCLSISDKEYEKILRGSIKWTCGRPDCVNSSNSDVTKYISEIGKKIDDIKKDQCDFKTVLKYMYVGFERMKNDLNLIQHSDNNKCNVESHLVSCFYCNFTFHL